jgi:hypothetical protein
MKMKFIFGYSQKTVSDLKKSGFYKWYKILMQNIQEEKT